MWKEVIKKVDDIKAKVNLQPPFYIRKINFKYPKGYRPTAKKDKEDTYQKTRDEAFKDKDKAKSYNSSTSANQPKTQAPKKDKSSCWGSHQAIGVNTTKIAKKDKDKTPKDLSHVKCCTYHQKGHYANKCPKKAKN